MKQLSSFLAFALCLGMITACAQTNGQSSDDDSKKPSGTAGESSSKTAMRPESDRYKQAGFAVYEEDGRLWVFRAESDNLKSFHEKGEPAKRVTLIGSGPDGKTVLGADKEVLEAYCAPYRYGAEGFVVIADDGRLWVFREGSENYAAFLAKGEPAKRVTLIGSGPDGKTVLGADKEVLEAYCAPYMYGVDGYVVIPDDGRLWVFREGSDHHAAFLAKGEPAKRVTLIGVGPRGKTLLGADVEVVKAYRVAALYGKPGFAVVEDDGRLWVFREGSAAHADFVAKGEPAKRVTLIGVGPDGMTLMGADRETLNAYLGGGNP